MKNILITICVGILCAPGTRAGAQTAAPVAKIISVRAGNNQNDSTFINLPMSSKEYARLSYDQNYLHFNFINDKDPSQRSFEYALQGLDYSWITCENCNQVQYAHLGAGDYSFKIKTTQPGDIPAEFNFTIEGNIWHRWWFVPMLFLYFLFFLGVLVYFFVLFRFRQQLREQRHIHKEKITSMAELTVGIAHEIQNPLNFVNNFSQLSMELAGELKDEIAKSDYDKGFINELTNDLLLNQQKIYQHGQRASGIVKGMLEHSRTGMGEFQPTNLNKLIEEQIAISYRTFTGHKDFLVKYDFDRDVNLPKINLMQDEIAKALFNLLNNAFYAAAEKKKSRLPAKEGPAYEPTVSVSTKRIADKVWISIKDNGTGIPIDELDKIFQPFFTTKPAGQGIGLGLSLSYSIIKAHHGELKVETAEGEGSEFIIQLPLK